MKGTIVTVSLINVNWVDKESEEMRWELIIDCDDSSEWLILIMVEISPQAERNRHTSKGTWQIKLIHQRISKVFVGCNWMKRSGGILKGSKSAELHYSWPVNDRRSRADCLSCHALWMAKAKSIELGVALHHRKRERERQPPPPSPPDALCLPQTGKAALSRDIEHSWQTGSVLLQMWRKDVPSEALGRLQRGPTRTRNVFAVRCDFSHGPLVWQQTHNYGCRHSHTAAVCRTRSRRAAQSFPVPQNPNVQCSSTIGPERPVGSTYRRQRSWLPLPRFKRKAQYDTTAIWTL